MASQSHRICVADSSSSRHHSQVGSSVTPSLKRCPFKWKCPVNSPTTHLNWSLFNFNRSLVLLAEDPSISPFACLSLVVDSQWFFYDLCSSSPWPLSWQLQLRCRKLVQVLWRNESCGQEAHQPIESKSRFDLKGFPELSYAWVVFCFPDELVSSACPDLTHCLQCHAVAHHVAWYGRRSRVQMRTKITYIKNWYYTPYSSSALSRIFFFFGAETQIWSLAYLHKTLRFTSVFLILDSR
jgi:hypothetical protein